jgi:hypothetical protein
MGQKLSISQEEENELYNLLQGGQPQKSHETGQPQPVFMMRMMAPTALAPQQRVMQPAVPARKPRVMEPAVKVRRAPVKQAQQVGQYH